jgi:hypothetical protein
LELLEAVRAFVEEDVAPVLDRRQRFHALVSGNLLAIVQRELQFEEAQLTAEWERLRELLGHTDASLPADRPALRTRVREWTEELAERIRRGEADGGTLGTAVRDHVSETVREKLRVANPRLVRS